MQEPATYFLREICEQIEQQFLKIFSNNGTLDNELIVVDKDASTSLQQLKSSLIRCISCKLPTIVKIQMRQKQKSQELQDELKEQTDRYRKIYKNYQQAKLENDNIKIQLMKISEAYENLTNDFWSVENNYHQFKEWCKSHHSSTENCKKIEQDQKQIEVQIRVIQPKENGNASEMNIQNKSVESSVRDKESNMNDLNNRQMQLQLYQQQLKYDTEIILSLKKEGEILRFEREKLKDQIDTFKDEKQRIVKNHNQNQLLLKGQRNRCDQLDRQLVDVLKNNQKMELQLEKQKQKGKQMEGKIVQEMEQMMVKFSLEIKDRERDKQSIVSALEQKKEQIYMLQTKLSQIIEKNLKYEQNIFEKQSIIDQQINKKQLHTQEIMRMNKDMKNKYAKKIQLLQGNIREYRERNKMLKEEIQELYQSIQLYVNKEIKEQSKSKLQYQKIGQMQNQLQEKTQNLMIMNENIKHQKAMNEELKKQLQKITQKYLKFHKMVAAIKKQQFPKIKEKFIKYNTDCQALKEQYVIHKKQIEFWIERYRSQLEIELMKFNDKVQFKINEDNYKVSKKMQSLMKNGQIYEEKYGQIMKENQTMVEEIKKLNEKIQDLKIDQCHKINEMKKQVQQQRSSHQNAHKVIDKLKNNCKEAEKIYRRVEILTKQNQRLKEHIQWIQNNPKFTDIAIQKSTNIYSPVQTSIGCKTQKLNSPQTIGRARQQQHRLQVLKKQYKMWIN